MVPQRGTRLHLALGVVAVHTGYAGHSKDVVYLLGILVAASVWAPGLGILMAVAGTVAFDFPPAWTARPHTGEFLTILAIFLALMLPVCALCKVARLLAVEMEARKESDLSAELARILLRAADPRTALPAAAHHLRWRLGLAAVSIELGAVGADERHVVFPLGGDGTLATLIVPADVTRPMLRRLRERVVPALEMLLRAVWERESAADTLRASRDESRWIADEQVALRHLATLVAHGVPPTEVLDAVAREMGRILRARHTVVIRYGPDGTASAVGVWDQDSLPAVIPPGSHWASEKGTVSELVWRTGKPGRIDAYEGTGELSTRLRERGIVSCVGCPITVGRSLWGAVIASSSTPEPLPAGTEEHMLDFTELAAAAVANAQSHADLKASRARVVTAADQTRRRIERDLHDGTQQRLITIGLQILAIQAAIPNASDQLKDQLSHIAHTVDEAIADLQEISRGLHPPILAKGGLQPALAALARRCPVAVELNVCLEQRLAERLEVAVYYLVSEAMTNVAKHAHASVMHVDLTMNESIIRLSIRDDGVGGADPARGSGLIGLMDRVDALGGRLQIVSPAGQGTSLIAEIPTQSDQ
jgi:signal transduction histidine kinase